MGCAHKNYRLNYVYELISRFTSRIW